MSKEQEKMLKETGVTPQKKEVVPSEVIELPSKGILYPEGHPLTSGTIEIKYPTAREEDILTSKNLIQKGIVIDKFIESLLVDPNIDINTLLLGDKNAIIMASRMLAYGVMYEVEIKCNSCGEKQKEKLDLSKIEAKECPALEGREQGYNEFEFKLPTSGKVIKYKVLSHLDEKLIDTELKSLKKFGNKNVDHEVTTRLRYAILSVDGETENIKASVDNMLSRDSKAFRDELVKVTPDVDLNFNFECENCAHEERIGVPLGVSFFWPS